MTGNDRTFEVSFYPRSAKKRQFRLQKIFSRDIFFVKFFSEYTDDYSELLNRKNRYRFWPGTHPSHGQQPHQRFRLENEVPKIPVIGPVLDVICPRAPDGDIFRPVKCTDTGKKYRFLAENPDLKQKLNIIANKKNLQKITSAIF